MSQFHNYDPGKVIVSMGQLPSPISGYAKGTFIELSRDVDAFTKSVGSDGEVTRVRNRNRAASLKITLQQGSQSNAMLSALAAADEATGAGVVPLTIADMSGVPGANTIAATAYAWVRKVPDAKLSGEAEETREWIIDMGPTQIFVGGN